MRRTVGPVGSREEVGVGFMRKDGVRTDHHDFDPGVHYSLVYVLEGDGEYVTADGEAFELKPGSFFHRIPGCIHSTYLNPSKPWIEAFVELGDLQSQALIQMGIVNPKTPVGFIGVNKRVVDQFVRLFHDLQNAQPNMLADFLPEILALLRDITVLGRGEMDSRREQLLRQASRELAENLNHQLDLKTYCRHNGWGYEWFRKSFRSGMGISPHQYRIRCRLDRARALLTANDRLPIAEIAEQLGYGTPFEFSAQFKKHIGISPSTFRQKKKGVKRDVRAELSGRSL